MSFLRSALRTAHAPLAFTFTLACGLALGACASRVTGDADGSADAAPDASDGYVVDTYDAAIDPDVHALGVGFDHACARMPDGTVTCWGGNTSGQLGDGTRAPHSRPQPVQGLTSVRSLVVGPYTSGAILDDGTVVSWGGTSALVPTEVPELRGATQIAVAYGATYGVLPDGTVHFAGPMRSGTRAGLSDVVEIAFVANVNLVALRRDGSVWFNPRNAGTTATTPIAFPGFDHIVHLAGGAGQFCGLQEGGAVLCARDGDATASTIVGVTDARQLAVGADFACALLGDRTVTCWGKNSAGQLGDGTRTDHDAPAPTVPFDAPVVQIAAYLESACAELETGRTMCWGSDWSGLLGVGTRTQVGTPVTVDGLDGVVDVEAGAGHTCARRMDGTVVCWGSNSRGALGDGTRVQSSRPVVAVGITYAIDLAAGEFVTCARLSGGAVRCWGLDTESQLGIAPVGDGVVPAPIDVPGYTGASHIALGPGLFSLANMSDGTVRVSGRGQTGSLGLGPTMDAVAQPIPGLASVVSIAIGSASAHAIAADGTVYGWGYALDGRLGIAGTIIDTPQPIASLTGAVEIADGLFHGCARMTDGTVRCWGTNAGWTAASSPDIPVTIDGVSSVAQIVSGFNFSCARRTDGVVVCWGTNSIQQLGLDVATGQSGPLPVPGIDSAIDVSAGEEHACAVLRDGTVRCWGSDSSGQLGDGVVVFRATPTAVQY